MKFSFAILLILIFASCSMMNQHGHFRLVKVEQKDVVILEKTELPESNEFTHKNVSEELSDRSGSGKSGNTLNSEDNPSINEIIPQKKQDGQGDDLEPEEEETDSDEEIVDQAIRAENNAKLSIGLFGGGIISIILPLVGVFFFIFGLVFYNRAKNSRYITADGERNLRMSRGLMIFDAVVLSLWALLILLLLALLFL